MRCVVLIQWSWLAATSVTHGLLYGHLEYCHKDHLAWGTVYLSPCFNCALAVVHLDPIQLFSFSPVNSLYTYLVHGHSMIVCFLFTSPFDSTRMIASMSQDLKYSTHICICICPWLLSFTVRWLVALPPLVGHCAIITWAWSTSDWPYIIYHSYSGCLVGRVSDKYLNR